MIAAKSESQESLTKLLIKCEGGVAHFCMYRLSKHFPNRIFIRMLVEKALHQNKGENQHRTLDSANRDPTQRHQWGPQDPKTNGHSAESSQSPPEQVPWAGVSREGS